MTGWAYSRGKMTLMYPNESITFVVVSDQEAKDIGCFVLGIGFFLLTLATCTSIELLMYGNFRQPFLAEEIEALTLPIFLFAFLTLALAPRGALVLCITAVAFVTAVGFGREALAEHSVVDGVYMFCIWHGGLLISFLMLWPYPMWQGLVYTYMFTSIAINCLMIAWLLPGSDLWAVIVTWFMGILVFLFGVMLRGLHSEQQDLVQQHYVRYGD